MNFNSSSDQYLNIGDSDEKGLSPKSVYKRETNLIMLLNLLMYWTQDVYVPRQNGELKYLSF